MFFVVFAVFLVFNCFFRLAISHLFRCTDFSTERAMSGESTKEEVVEAPAETKPKFTPTLILALLAGLLLILLIGGTVYHFQSGKALRAELAAAKEEAKHKTLTLTEAQAQIAGLSRQLHALREFSLNKADTTAAEGAAVTEKKPQQPADSSPPVAATPAPPATAKKEALAAKPETAKKEAVAAAPVTKKSKPANLDCQLAGKSPEEQTATLKRCTEAMDGRK